MFKRGLGDEKIGTRLDVLDEFFSVIMEKSGCRIIFGDIIPFLASKDIDAGVFLNFTAAVLVE